MKKLLLGLLVFGLTTQFMFPQVEVLPEVELDVNYKYLNAVNSNYVPEAVKNLENKVAFYSLTESDFYNVEFDTYHVKFFIPKGKIVADYDKNGEIIGTFEQFKNVRLPNSVLISIYKRYPEWNIVEDAYMVDYFDGIAKKEYKIKLKNKNKKKTIRIDDVGEIL